MDMIPIAFFYSADGVPAVVLYFPEEFVVQHHSGTTGFVVFKPDKTTIPITLLQVRTFFRKYVGVNVYFKCIRH
jgi:hypothetical protein